MHSLRTAQQMKLRDAIFADDNNDYWFDRGMENFGKLTKIMGEAETNKWFDAQPKPTNWRQISAMCTEKIQALELAQAKATEAALYRLDWDSIEYVQI